MTQPPRGPLALVPLLLWPAVWCYAQLCTFRDARRARENKAGERRETG